MRDPVEGEVYLRRVTKVDVVTDYIVPKQVFDQGPDAVNNYLSSGVDYPYLSHADRHENYWQASDPPLDVMKFGSSPRIWEN